MTFNLRNIVRVDNETIDCELLDSEHGWINFSASSGDKESFGREVYEHILTLPESEIGTYVAPEKDRSEIEAARKAAYANPFTGSDRLFAEAQRMQLMNESGWEEVRDQAIQRFQEIQNQYPWE